MIDFIKNMKNNHKILFAVLSLLILLAIFWPRERNLFDASFSAKFGNLGGKIQLEAFENKKIFALFYAPWCGHCKNMMPEWDKLITFYKDNPNPNVDVVKINCDENKDLAKKHDVDGFPTIKFLPYGLNDPKGTVYDGNRNFDDFHSYIMKNIK